MKRLLLAVFLCFSSFAWSAQKQTRVPIVFHPGYDITLASGLTGIVSWFHPFDMRKFGKIARHLQESCNLCPEDFYAPQAITDGELKKMHSDKYLQSLHTPDVVARVTQVSLLQWFSDDRLQNNLLQPMRLATAGTIMGAKLALEHGWAINLGGGYHHAKADEGSGNCFFADIPLAIMALREKHPKMKVLVVDLDAHQGNGVECCMKDDPLTAIFDMYAITWPWDYMAKQWIKYDLKLRQGTGDEVYLQRLREVLPKAIDEFQPDFIIYNAGSDILVGDSYGTMNITRQGLITRDAFVFHQALSHKIPILMVLSGGYTLQSVETVGASIESIIKTNRLINVGERKPQAQQLHLKLSCSRHSNWKWTAVALGGIAAMSWSIYRWKSGYWSPAGLVPQWLSRFFTPWVG